jgi:hypothetical protein
MHAAVSAILRPIRRTRFGRCLNMPRRFALALHYVVPEIFRQLFRVVTWTFRSREDTNYTYNLTDRNMAYLAHTLAVVSGRTFEDIAGLLEEPSHNEQLTLHIENTTRLSLARHYSDERCVFGRRLAWYALVRALRPRVVVETGVDRVWAQYCYAPHWNETPLKDSLADISERISIPQQDFYFQGLTANLVKLCMEILSSHWAGFPL